MNGISVFFFFALLANATVFAAAVGNAEKPHPSASAFPAKPDPHPQSFHSATPTSSPDPVTAAASIAASISAPAASASPSAIPPSPSAPAPSSEPLSPPTAAASGTPSPVIVSFAPASPAASTAFADEQPRAAQPTPAAGTSGPAPVDPTDTAPVAQEPAEIPSVSPGATSEAVCFPADATVVLESGEVTKMDNLEVGHRVQVGKNQFSTVVMFTHALPNVKHTFVRLTTASGNSIRATEGHYIYTNGELTRMGDVVVGNLLENSSGSSNEKVVRITRETGCGLFNPQTAHGDIIVDGIRASTYTQTVPKKAAHAMLAPVRAAFEWTGMQINVLEKIVW